MSLTQLEDARKPNLDEAIQRLEASGFMLARLETLSLAIRDNRVDRGCLRVLAELVQSMNRETWTSWLGRDELAHRCEMTAKAAGNYVYRLKALGYIVGDKRQTPQADNRVLMHYTLSALSPEELDSAITRAVGSIRGKIDTVSQFSGARQDRQISKEVPAPTGKKLPVGTGSASQDGQQVPAVTGKSPESARGDGDSTILTISSTENTKQKEVSAHKRPTRLPADWTLPTEWANDTLLDFVITREGLANEAGKFKRYFLSAPTRNASKANWEMTFHNWIAKYHKRSRPDTSAAPDLFSKVVPTRKSIDLMTLEEKQARSDALWANSPDTKGSSK